MRYAALLTATLASFAHSAPLDGAGLENYGSYGAYGAYSNYGKYDASLDAAPQPLPAQDNSQAPADAPADAPVAVQNAAPNNFLAVTTKSGDDKFHQRPIVANGQRFFIGKDTSTYCPLPDCSKYANFTVFLARPYDLNSGLGLYTNVAGGQAVFVTNKGELGYTQAHSGSSPPGSVNNPFQYTPGTDPGTTGTLNFNSKSFAACPVAGEAGVYQIYVSGDKLPESDCTEVGVATSTYNGTPAYQYN